MTDDDDYIFSVNERRIFLNEIAKANTRMMDRGIDPTSVVTQLFNYSIRRIAKIYGRDFARKWLNEQIKLLSHD